MRRPQQGAAARSSHSFAPILAPHSKQSSKPALQCGSLRESSRLAVPPVHSRRRLKAVSSTGVSRQGPATAAEPSQAPAVCARAPRQTKEFAGGWGLRTAWAPAGAHAAAAGGWAAARRRQAAQRCCCGRQPCTCRCQRGWQRLGPALHSGGGGAEPTRRRIGARWWAVGCRPCRRWV